MKCTCECLFLVINSKNLTYAYKILWENNFTSKKIFFSKFPIRIIRLMCFIEKIVNSSCKNNIKDFCWWRWCVEKNKNISYIALGYGARVQIYYYTIIFFCLPFLSALSHMFSFKRLFLCGKISHDYIYTRVDGRYPYEFLLSLDENSMKFKVFLFDRLHSPSLVYICVFSYALSQ